MEKEEFKIFETLLKEGPIKALKELKDKVSYNNSFIDELNKENTKYGRLITMIEQTDRIEKTNNVKHLSKNSMTDEIKTFFKDAKSSKNVKDVIKHIRKQNIKTTNASIYTTLSILTKEGFLIRPSKGKYIIKYENGEIKPIARNIQYNILNILKNAILSPNQICDILAKDGHSTKTCKDAIYNLTKKGEIEKSLDGFYSIKNKIPTLAQKVITLDTIRKCFETRKEMTVQELKKYLVDTKKMSYSALHGKLKRMVDNEEIIRLEVGKYKIKE